MLPVPRPVMLSVNVPPSRRLRRRWSLNRVGQADPGHAAIVVIDHEFKLCSILTDAERKRSLVTIDRQGECQRLADQEEVVLWGIVDFLFRDLRP